MINKFTVFLLIFITVLGCKEKSNKDISDPTDSFESSFKENLKKENDLEDEILFDEKSKIYTNKLYNISMDFPDHWEVDMGTTENSLVRGIERDSGIAFIVIPIELKKDSRQYKLQNQLIDVYESDQKMYEKVMSDNIERMTGEKILSYETEKSFIKNQPSIKSRYKTIIRDLDVEYEMTTVTHNFWKAPYSYTLSLSLPSVWYEENPKKYDWLYSNFFFTKY